MRWRCAAMTVSTALLGELARGREQSERVRMSERSGFASLFYPYWPDRPGRCQRAATMRCMWPGSSRPRCARPTDSNRPLGRLPSHLRTTVTPNPFRISKNSITKNCRATCDLQLCLNELRLIHHGFQNAKLQSVLL